MKKTILLGIGCFVASTLTLQAQDLEGFQKLRGEPISSTAIPYTLKAWGEGDGPTYHISYSAFDTNKQTFFKSEEKGGWVGLDLGSQQVVKKVRIFPRPDKTERMQGCKIEGANKDDFSDAVTLYTITEKPTHTGPTVYDITNSNSFRYLRCIASDTYECNLAELEFYADTESQTVTYPQLSNLPTIYIETKGQFDFEDKEQYKQSTIIVSDESGIKSYPGEVRGRGNSTWMFMEKKPFRIKFEKKQRFLGLPANAKSWTLLSNYVDKTFIRNGLAFEMARIMGFAWTPTCTYADLVLDGYYYGTFMVADHVQIHEDRINITEMKTSDIYGNSLTGGYHLEIDAYANKEEYNFSTNNGVAFSIKNPDDPCEPEQQAYIREHIQKVEDALLYDVGNTYLKYLDLASAVKYYLHSELTANIDSYWTIPCYKKRGDNKLYIGPVWDYDQAFFTGYRIPEGELTLDRGHGMGLKWFKNIMSRPEAKKQLKIEWQNIIENDLEQVLIDYLDEHQALLQESAALNYERWPALGDKVWWFNGHTFKTFDEYFDFMKEKMTNRFAFVEKKLSNTIYDIDYFLTPSQPEFQAQLWKYQIYDNQTSFDDNHNPNWYKPSYVTNNTWKNGNAPFFNFRRGMSNNGTNWKTPGNETGTILLRKTFNVTKKQLENLDYLNLTLYHDEDVWIYINGEEAFKRSGHNFAWESFLIDKKYLKEGENLIAVKCIQTGGDQMIDVGIIADRPYVEVLIGQTVSYLPISKGAMPMSWKYTTDEPGDDWYKDTFDDKGWDAGKAPFGHGYNDSYNTNWEGDNSTIYLRRTFNVKNDYLRWDFIEQLTLRLRYDDECEVYINGQKVLAETGTIDRYQVFNIENVLRLGSNTIAIKCHNVQDDQYIDAGVYALVSERALDVSTPTTNDSKYQVSLSDNTLTIEEVEPDTMVRLYSIDGRLVAQQKATTATVQFNLHEKGIYLINLYDLTIKVINN